MTPFEDPFNDPIRPSGDGLTPTQYRIANERLQCSVHGCRSKRNGPTPYCLPHYRKIVSVRPFHLDGLPSLGTGV
ncbi:MAG: hypothetical protein KJ011_05045, partial [Burkholderiaceae bacterium]|nr:hypothetical protein [Burkholderiaceae bacterium]